jgi:hypothetical protein
MKTFWSLLIPLVVTTTMISFGGNGNPATLQVAKIETFYDSNKDRTTVRLAPVEIASDQANTTVFT